MSIQTENRERKIELLKKSLDGIILLLLLDKKDRDWIGMSNFKELLRKVESMVNEGKPLSENST